ncbi:AAA family ATPase [Aeromicrobium sp. NPDC092404]|uniref:AAA family ATPase n=1 Tax=Aeromicrobium sp. NPDC092404 TaxID=3154976 RepID=UPI00343E621E
MTSTDPSVEFALPVAAEPADAVHRAIAASGNAAIAAEASGQLLAALSGDTDIERILIKAAAGAGKSYVLKKLVEDAVNHVDCRRVAVVAFQNRQLWPIAKSLGERLGRDAVTLLVAKGKSDLVPDDVGEAATVVEAIKTVPQDTQVVISTSHKMSFDFGNTLKHLGAGANGEAPYDVLFIDEAWQLPHHLFDPIQGKAPITIGVGDVGQLPPLEIGTNPWRGDPGFNPYRAWPTNYYGDPDTFETELPAVWRPTAEQLSLWRAFYPEWEALNCVAAPGDRLVELGELDGLAATVWAQVATGVPTLLEVDGLPDPEAADVDLPLVEFAEALLEDLFAAKFALVRARLDDTGTPTGEWDSTGPGDEPDDTLVTVLATRNQTVDDATDAVERLRKQFDLTEKDLIASTVDSWQGQTNGITLAIHPLTGAAQLDEFNSQFGRLAVTCTRATHGLLMLSRPGLDQLLNEAPARPGTPFGEPGNRHLPRQTHQRILATFARGTVNVALEG